MGILPETAREMTCPWLSVRNFSTVSNTVLKWDKIFTLWDTFAGALCYLSSSGSQVVMSSSEHCVVRNGAQESPSFPGVSLLSCCHQVLLCRCSAPLFHKSSYVFGGGGTDNNNRCYSPSKGYLASTGALTDCSLTWSRGWMLCLWQEKARLWRQGRNPFIKTKILIFKNKFICGLACLMPVLPIYHVLQETPLSFTPMFTCRGLFFSAVSLTVAVMNHQTEIL